MRPVLAIQLTEPGADPERLDELTSRLRNELLQLDVDDVRRASAGEAPEGSRAFELAAVGTLLVTMHASGSAVANVVRAVRSWVARSPEPARTVRLTLGDKTIELTGASGETQDRLVAEFVRAMRTGEGDGR